MGAGDGQGSLACCSPCGHKESGMTEQMNWTELMVCYHFHMSLDYVCYYFAEYFCIVEEANFTTLKCIYLAWGFSSIQFSQSVVFDSLRPHELQHARPPCPTPTPRAYPNSCPLSGWCHPTISSSVVPFSSCPLSFRASGSFQMSQFFTTGGWSIGVSALTSDLPMNTQDWSPLG